jgi:addiction module RelE/StbE family toxin
MKALVWSTAFARAFKRLARHDPELRDRVEHALEQLAQDPFYPTLHTHKLKGELAGTWACTVDYDNRILFEFIQNPQLDEEEILLLTVGTHDEVY